MKDVRISYREQWGVRHWRSIHDAYRRSPWFEYYAHGLEPLFKERPEYLDEWNRMTQQWVLKQLKWTGEWGQTETPGERVEYKSAPMTEAPYRYPQVFEDRHGFVANLCILDLLFCEGPGAKGILEAARRENGGA